ncbi:PRP38-domain-containing protein, partial [Neoconidiobolus thromboides FSU 785]
MSKQTYGEASTIHGQDPQSLIETILRSRIYESLYWKEYCHGLNAETLVERAVELQTIGGHYGNQRPTEFICLLLKLLQIQPEKEIVYELINNDDFKYLRALAAFYLRLTGNSIEIYTYLEPLLTDYRKLRRKLRTGSFQLTYIDEFIDELLHSERVCDIILPPLMKRHILEESDELPPYISLLEDEL